MDWLNRPIRPGFWQLLLLVAVFTLVGALLFTWGRVSA